MEDVEFLDSPLLVVTDFWELLFRFGINLLVVFAIVRLLYYPRCRRRDYFFTFMLISVSIFLLIFLLGSVKVKIGFALGLFAIFGIIRYRTEQMPVREMTYMFVIISISVINALSSTFSYIELLTTDMLFIVSIWLCESKRWLKHVSCKIIEYDRIELAKPCNRTELLQDLKERTGLDILKVEVGAMNFLKDSVILKIYYTPECDEINTVDGLNRIPKSEYTLNN